jgi:hypothetical protein
MSNIHAILKQMAVVPFTQMKTQVARATKPIPFGTTVLTFNKWTGYQNNNVKTYFRPAKASDIRKLKVGDSIWIDTDPLHPNGKVYGFVKNLVSGRRGNKICFNDGFTSLHDNIYFVDDEAPLAELIAEDPLSTDVIGESGRAVSAMFLGVPGAY